jgi:hypothetical protein
MMAYLSSFTTQVKMTAAEPLRLGRKLCMVCMELRGYFESGYAANCSCTVRYLPFWLFAPHGKANER